MLAVCVRTGFGHQSPAAALTGKTFLHSEVREGLVFFVALFFLEENRFIG